MARCSSDSLGRDQHLESETQREKQKERETEEDVKKGGGWGGWGWWRGMSVVRVCIINNPDQ